MFSRIASAALLTVCCLFFSGCSSTYYQVTDTGSGKVYYTHDVKVKKTGGVTFVDAKTGAAVNSPAYEIRAISKDTFNEGLAAGGEADA